MSNNDPLAALSFKPIRPRINPHILLYTPPPVLAEDGQPQRPSLPGPKVIILATWLGAATPARIAVYCRAYQALYPQTPILLIRTEMADISVKNFIPFRRKRELWPARKYLLSVFPRDGSPNANATTNDDDNNDHSKQRGALLHVFSMGGCNTAVQLSRIHRSSSSGAGSERYPPAFPLPLLGVVLDCCPGSDSFSKTYRASLYSIPEGSGGLPALRRTLGRIVLWPQVRVFWRLQQLGVLASFDALARDMNDVLLLGPAPRLYLYSRRDRVIAAEDVEAHAREIAAKGVAVTMEAWEDAEHCALPMKDARRYWNAIEAFVAKGGGERTAKL